MTNRVDIWECDAVNPGMEKKLCVSLSGLLLDGAAPSPPRCPRLRRLVGLRCGADECGGAVLSRGVSGRSHFGPEGTVVRNLAAAARSTCVFRTHVSVSANAVSISPRPTGAASSVCTESTTTSEPFTCCALSFALLLSDCGLLSGRTTIRERSGVCCP